MAFAFALAGCGGKSDVKPVAAGKGEPLPTAEQMSAGGPSASTGGQQQAAQPAAAPGPLDTSTWVIKPPFYAAGQEPYWRLQIDDGWFVFKRSGLAEIEAPMLQPKKVAGADVFETPPLVVTIKRAPCETSEGQHGDISALVKYDDTDFDGCAYSGQLSPQGVSAEASAVVDDIKVVDACLAKIGQPALITSIYPREGGRTAAALKTKDGTLYECGVEPDGGQIAFMDEIEPGSEGAWMKKMRFLRAGQSDQTKCDGAEEVKSGEKVLGRLLTAKCKF